MFCVFGIMHHVSSFLIHNALMHKNVDEKCIDRFSLLKTYKYLHFQMYFLLCTKSNSTNRLRKFCIGDIQSHSNVIFFLFLSIFPLQNQQQVMAWVKFKTKENFNKIEETTTAVLRRNKALPNWNNFIHKSKQNIHWL